MKAIELVPIDAVTYQVRETTIVGMVQYIPDGEQYPWKATTVYGDASKFRTKAEAVQYASTGKA